MQSAYMTLYCVNRLILLQVTPFSISDTIPGSTTSYRILSSSSNSSQPACTEDTCEYTFPPDCSGSSVDIAVAAANKLGIGPSSEPNTIGMCFTGQRLLCFVLRIFYSVCIYSFKPMNACRILVNEHCFMVHMNIMLLSVARISK